MHKAIVKHNLIWVLFILLLAPGILALYVMLHGDDSIYPELQPHYKLQGMTTEPKTIDINLTNLQSHKVQSYLETKLTNNLPLRSLFIRINNQTFYNIFKKSYSYNGSIIIGKSYQLFEQGYISNYCQQRYISNLSEWANKVKALSDFFEKKGQIFIYVITPSKAEYMPEAIPNRFHCKNVGISPHVKEMERLLKQRKVRYVNGPQLMQEMTKKYGISMFPKGGTHWNMLGASAVANAIHQLIVREGKQINPIRFDFTLNKHPILTDKDLLSLLNLAKQNYRYQVPTLQYRNDHIDAKPTTAAIIGGSFTHQLIQFFLKDKIFSKMTDYRYFKLDKTDLEQNKSLKYDEVDYTSKQYLDSILAANVIILEENSSITASNHGSLFYDMMKKFSL